MVMNADGRLLVTATGVLIGVRLSSFVSVMLYTPSLLQATSVLGVAVLGAVRQWQAFHDRP
jgi:hypothetical protein